MHSVVMYTTPTCHFCQMTKAFFKEKGVQFSEYDVAADMAKRQEMMEKSGQLGVPVIVIDDKDIVIGFDQPKLSQLLGIS